MTACASRRRVCRRSILTGLALAGAISIVAACGGSPAAPATATPGGPNRGSGSPYPAPNQAPAAPVATAAYPAPSSGSPVSPATPASDGSYPSPSSGSPLPPATPASDGSYPSPSTAPARSASPTPTSTTTPAH